MKYLSKKLVQAQANDNFACVLKSALEISDIEQLLIR